MEKKIEILAEVFSYLERFDEVIDDQIHKIDEGNINSVYNIIGQMSEGIEWLLGAFKVTEDVQVQSINVEQINGIINNIVEALENNDMTLLKDTFEYELIEQIREWKNDVKTTLDYYNK